MRIAVTGRHGQVALSLQERASLHDVEVVTISRPDADILNEADIFSALEAASPDVVVNAAAYTAVDLAESEPDQAQAVNATGAANVARSAAKLGLPIVQISTDYVFNGDLRRPYVEDDETGPANVYGRSKLEGERAVAAATSDHAILRTAWVYSPFGKNFVKTMLSLATQRDTIRVVADQMGAPTNALDIADGVIMVAKNLVKNPDRRDMRGVFHMTAGGDATWADFARQIFTNSSTFGGPSAQVVSISTSEYPTPAARPANSRLSNDKIDRVHGIRLRPWQEPLAACVARIASSEIKAGP